MWVNRNVTELSLGRTVCLVLRDAFWVSAAYKWQNVIRPIPPLKGGEFEKRHVVVMAVTVFFA